jgi:putative nucleotidyltransferase with HDIG domain
MRVNNQLRLWLFLRLFLLLGGASAVCYATLLLALKMPRFQHLGWLPALLLTWLLAAIVALLAAWYVSSRSKRLANCVRSRDLQMPASKVGPLFAEVAVAWNDTRQALIETQLQQQAAADRNYTTLTEFIRMVAKAVDERSSYLHGHSDRVAEYSAAIAREFGMNGAEVERVRLAGLLHDIGAVGIEDSIVAKNSPLTPEEFEVVKAHTVKGAAILRPVEWLHDIIPAVELHHESLDGHGYPYGLRGQEIPLMARIIAVADSFDAMTTSRPYQSAMDPEYTLEVLNRLGGTRYDRRAVEALTELVKRGDIVVKSPRKPAQWQRRRAVTEVI